MDRGLVYVVDDNTEFRRSMRWLLESDGYEVIDFAEGIEFLDRYPAISQRQRAEVLVLDMRMPGMTGLQLQEALRGQGICIATIFITAHGDVPLAVEAMRKGALHFIEKPFADTVLLEAVAAAMAGAAEQKRRVQTGSQARARVGSLTARERQVLDLVIEGRLNKTIADLLGISIKTVELHRAHMMEKMGATSLAHLVQLAVAARD